MDIDENDILLTNQFISKPDITTEVPTEFNEEFQKYYKKQIAQEEEKNLRETLERTSIKSIYLDEDTDANNIINTNQFENVTDKQNTGSLVRKVREVRTYVSVDSRDRDRVKFTKPNHFKIFLGQTFYNVKEVKLATIEFPNTNAVINSTNNGIFWRNQEDIDDNIIDNITKTYPVYAVNLRIGSYITTSLQSEMVNKIASLKRKNKTGDFHYFIIDLDIDTDIVTFTSLILAQLGNNPFSVSANLGLVRITLQDHGYKTGDIIYIVGAKNLAGIPGSSFNTSHVITVLNNDTFEIEINVKAGETAIGGGNTVKCGRLAPFQLLFGENTNTLAPNIGFPNENSSQRIDTYIKTLVNFYQVKIVTTEKHNFTNTFDFINQTCQISNAGTTPSIDGNRVITKIIDDFTFLVSVNNKLSFGVGNTGQVTFDSRTIDIVSVSNNDIDTVLVETFTPHNYETVDIDKRVIFYGTTSVPEFDQENAIYSVLSPTRLLIPGLVLDGGDTNVLIHGDGGTIPLYNPLQSHTRTITSVVPGTITTITCPSHGLKVGDRVKFYNIVTSPSLTQANSGIHTVHTILNSNTFTVNFLTTSNDVEVINKEQAYIGLSTLTVSFPYHGFNAVVNIESVVDIVDPLYNVEITTQLPHGLETGSKVRVMNTETTPPIDGGGYIVKVVDTDTFRIIFPGGIGISTGTTGIIGMSNEFYIYGATDVGGIEANAINNIKYNVRSIVDEHRFTFDSSSFATTTTKGGGNNVFISSLRHGFNGVQTNTKNSLLNRSINLEGENYVFLCCPQLATMMNTGSVKDIFARITLDQSPGSMVFNFLSNPKTFDTVPLNTLSELEFSIANWDGTLYEFNDLDWSCVLEITELLDTTESFNYSSRRGIPH
jgi:hypothetical protein